MRIKSKTILALFLILFGTSKSFGQCGITFSVAPNEALGINSVILSLAGTDAHVGFSVGIDWGDGTPWSIGFEEEWVHTYPGPGTYEICLNFVAPDCIQEDYCESYTLSESPDHSSLCPLTVSYSVSGTVLTVDAEGSGADDPSLSFHPDILSFIEDPWDFSDFQFISDHSGEFNYTYSPPSPDATYLFCVGYVDMEEPVACEDNDYCASVTFGNPTAGIDEVSTDFLSTIQAYPVPASTYINIHFSEASESKDVNWKIIGLDGKLILKGTLQEQLSTIYLPTSMAEGNYQLVLSTDTKERTINFIKE